MTQNTEPWRQANTITDWEMAEIGKLLCDHAARDLALMVVRGRGQLEVERMWRANIGPTGLVPDGRGGFTIEVKELPNAN